MTDNPFSEPDDSDRTIIRPMPGGKRTTPPPATTPPAPSPFDQAPRQPASAPQEAAYYAPAQPARPVSDAPESIGMGGSPLLVAAGPLLQLLARLRNTMSQPDAGNLRDRATQEMRRFEETARAQNIPMDQLRPAHYALCASLDDVVLATPWGSQGAWAARSMVSTFHQEVRSGERFFDVLRQLQQNPGNFLPVLELMYFCLSLGYMGRYRLSPRGPAEIDKLREDTYAVIRRLRPAGEAALSPRWQGVNAPYRAKRLVVPLWLAAVVALGILGLVYGAFLFSLSSRSDQAFQVAVTAPPATMPDISRAQPVVAPAEPPAAGPTILQRISGFLQPEITAGKVSVLGTNSQPIVRINNSGLFASGQAEVEAGDIPLLQRIGTALGRETGGVVVTGYTDNQPIHTLQFPSNFELSAARAQAAAAILDQTIGDQSRITAKGLGSANPVASNDTADGRAQNRRIEIVLNHGSEN
ncbi:MAG: flagellar motor protein MotB [Acidocella sp. 20-57-95]|nr:MAG: flagellar motor protein MotB [Acidocella sp. 20-57-95]OYV62527.1 MAG: flagellar motor protein MotB [Acidocella sp. 21-58-7]HQT63795.1 type IVB secretion system protein IcmH/DotU [Acidocella sp.]HQU03199.1 type IVB secretion system protein IcmH/DotU [Acidocella sp.]